jgi:hypothetical protein
MEDMLIGKAITKARQNASVALVAVPILQADEMRYAFSITTDGAAIVYIGDSPDVTAATGFPLKITDNPIQFCADEYGDFVRGGVWAIGGAAGPTNVGIIMSMFSLERFIDLKKYHGAKNGA